MLLRFLAREPLIGLWLLSVPLPSCGARAEGREVDINPPPLAPIGAVFGADGGVEQTCTGPLDCAYTDLCFPRACVEGRCEALPPIECSDGDDCTADFCDPDTGQCSFTDRTLDEDQDGFKAALPGYAPGAAGACGNDCDDSSPLAHPGGKETCDGVDNDCNGVVDDQYEYVPPTAGPMWVSSGAIEAGVGGIAHTGEFFGLSFSSRSEHNQNQLMGVYEPGRIALPAVPIAKLNSDTYAGPLVWTGRAFATAWEDRRDDNFEIYFNRLDAAGNKLGADVRLSNAIDFSLNPDVVYTGQEYLVVWGDRRNGRDDFRIYGQRIARDGALLSDENVDLSRDIPGAESPSLALSGGRFGLAFNAQLDGPQVTFLSLNLDLSTPATQVLSRPGGVGASVTPNNGQFVVSWHEYQNLPGDAIWASVVSPDGEILVQAQRVTEPAEFARSHSLLPMGDRLLLLWAQYHGASYDLFSRLLAADLTPLSEAQRITFSEGDALGPSAAFGANGEVGILYTDYTTGSPQVYFTSMSCQ